MPYVEVWVEQEPDENDRAAMRSALEAIRVCDYDRAEGILGERLQDEKYLKAAAKERELKKLYEEWKEKSATQGFLSWSHSRRQWTRA